MQCPQCQHENSEAAKFCEECGTRLVRTCPGCGHEVSPRAKFCPACGTPLTEQSRVRSLESRVPPSRSYTPRHLAERILAEQAAMETRGATDGERKTITALFANMAGSTALMHDLDPEDARRLIDPVLQLMMDAVHRYEGYVAQSLGDGIFALFGAPIAHEDHPQRALYAALLMQEEMRRYADRIRLEKGVPLQMRVGINTGEVVVRAIRKEDLHTDYLPVGHSTNIASRMESIAQISQGPTAYRATGAEFAQSYFLALLTMAYGKAGRVKEGLNALTEALAVIDETGERFYEAELYRLKGQLTLQKFQVSGFKFQVTNPQHPTPNPQTEAEECFLKAIEIARRQQAKSLELRAVMSLARLWQQQGKKKEEARRMLADIYGWFTEGFDTADLKEAKALLEVWE